MRRFVVPITVDESGDAVVYTPVMFGHLVSIRYVKDDFADGVDFTCVLEDSGETVWAEESVNASATKHPRAAAHSTAGAALTYDGTYAVSEKIAVSGERIQITVADGGNATSGTLHFTIDG